MSVIEAFQKDKLRNLGKSLKYSLHVIFRPFDGFWDLTHENRGSIGAATIIYIMWIITQAWDWTYSGFVIRQIQWEYFNILMQIIPPAVLFLIWCISNWSLTTLMDGKGKLSQIYMGSAYALTPYILIHLPLIPLSHLMTVDEKTYWTIFSQIATIWCAILLLCAMMMIHDYSLGKAVLSSILAIIGMMIIIFLILLFLSMITQSFGYFISLYKEITFRLY